jgi:PhoH-like ATPase
MIKTFILDTNVLLHNPDAIYAFEDNQVVIPFAVIEEIDSQKMRQDEIGRNARLISKKLDELRAIGHLSNGVPLPSGGQIKIELNHQSLEAFPSGLDRCKHDNRILAVAYHLHQECPGKVFMVTKDLNLRVKADVFGIPADDLFRDTIDYPQLYEGVGHLNRNANDLNALFRDGRLGMVGEECAYPHQFFILKNPDYPSQSALCRHLNHTLYPLNYADTVNYGVKARNKEQKFVLELLMNEEIRVVTLVGKAGTGKTLLALAAGLAKVIEQKVYRKLLITRPVIPIGNDLGYLPGPKEDKLRPWMQPIFDNLELLYADVKNRAHTIEQLIENGTLEMEALTYIRGRSIPKQFIICDEAQNLTPLMIKTLITRVGEKTKIVFTGDPEQIDNPYLNAGSNGLTYLVEKLKGEEIAGHVILHKGERSVVAEMGARLL